MSMSLFSLALSPPTPSLSFLILYSILLLPPSCLLLLLPPSLSSSLPLLLPLLLFLLLLLPPSFLSSLSLQQNINMTAPILSRFHLLIHECNEVTIIYSALVPRFFTPPTTTL